MITVSSDTPPVRALVVHFAAGSDLAAATARALVDGGIVVDATGPSDLAAATIAVSGASVDGYSMRTASNFDATGILDVNAAGVWESQAIDVNDSAAYIMPTVGATNSVAVSLLFNGGPSATRTQGWATVVIVLLPP